MSEKIFLNNNELIDYLCDHQKIKKDTIISEVFSELTYEELFRSYAEFISDGLDGQQKQYILEKNFTEILEWTKLDRACSLLLHLFIGTFEKRLRAYIIQTICSLMSSNGDKQCVDNLVLCDYCQNPDSPNKLGLLTFNEALNLRIKPNLENSYEQNYELRNREGAKIKNAITQFSECFGSKIQNTTSKQVTNTIGSYNTIEKHFLDTYGFLPAYCGLSRLSFSQITVLFGILPKEKQKEFWNIYKNNTRRFRDDEDYSSQLYKLKTLVNIRNTVNHYDSLFPELLKNRNIGRIKDIISALKANNNSANTSFNSTFLSESFNIPMCHNKDHNVNTRYKSLKTLVEAILN